MVVWFLHFLNQFQIHFTRWKRTKLHLTGVHWSLMCWLWNAAHMAPGTSCVLYVCMYTKKCNHIFNSCCCRDGYDKIAEIKKLIREVSGPRVKKVGVFIFAIPFWMSYILSSIDLSGKIERQHWKHCQFSTGDSDLVPSQLQLVFSDSVLQEDKPHQLAKAASSSSSSSSSDSSEDQ